MSTTSLTLLLLLLIGCGLCLLRLEGLFEVLGRFVGFAFVVHCYLGLVSFGHGFDFLLPLLLLGVVLEEAGAVLFLIHADVGVEVFTLFVDHVLEVEGASRVKSLSLLLGQLKSTELAGSALALPWVERLLLTLTKTLAVVEDELDALLIGIDLERSVEGLAVLG